jgi:hypothetical protein
MLIFLFFFIAFLPILSYTYGTDKQRFAEIVFYTWLVITALPPLILHINYFINDRKCALVIDSCKRIVTLKKGSKKQIYKFGEIIRIEKYHSKNQEGLFAPGMHWHTYYFYKIILEGKEPICLSNMIISDLEKEFTDINFVSIRVPFPVIS